MSENTQNNLDQQEVDVFEVDIYPTEILRSRAEEYTPEEFGPELLELGQKMLRTMYSQEGIGLAANQIGLLKRIIVLDCTEDRSIQYIMINPVITHKEGTETMEEGCLSVPGIRGDVTRAEKITVEYHDPQGNPHSLTTDGLTAVCIQHEVDHLNGVMFFDYFPRLQRQKALDKLRKWVKQQQRCRKK